ncbi:MAG: response regulator [Desulfomonile tiedjei]|uniref:Response regulator n=1 Tax=Desulfomonile tiedjei TaxID=2358 RepID=A0A9D6V003_9BACT|nr:response regulator [Desulfomonile tiedjei]
MDDQSILEHKKLLVVDDEADILEIIREQFPNTIVITGQTFESALELINKDKYDLAILDIMGVNGFELLRACRARHLPAAMLTARAINVESINMAIREGAVSFLPKEELNRLPELVAEILGELEQGRTHWAKLFERLGSYFKNKLGITWEDLEKPQYPGYH